MSDLDIKQLMDTLNAPQFYALRYDETANVTRFKEMFKDKFMFVPQLGWFYWDGQVWREDELNEVFARTEDIASVLDREWDEYGPKEDDDPDYDKKRGHFQLFRTRTLGIRSRQQLVAAATAAPGLKFAAKELNRDIWSLVVQNGTLNLRTGEMRESLATDRNTQRANVAYDPEAECPRFDELLKFAFDGNEEFIAYIWRVLGYTLSGSTSEQNFFFMFGKPGSGKTTICEVMTHILGDYALQLDDESLVGRGQHPTWIADMVGKRMYFKDEMNHDRQTNTALINSLVSGGTIKGRKMRGNFTDIPIHGKLFITSNHMPKMGNAQDGVWRRIKVVTIDNVVAADQKVLNFAETLAAEEGSGILNKALAGLRDYLEGEGGKPSLRTPIKVDVEVKSYKDSEDEFLEFIEDTIVKTDDPFDFVAQPDLYAIYKLWCEESGNKPKDKNPLFRRLVQMGHRQLATGVNCKNKNSSVQRTQRGFLGMKINIDASSSFMTYVFWHTTAANLSFDKCKK